MTMDNELGDSRFAQDAELTSTPLVREVLAHNATLLNTELPSTLEGATIYRKMIDGKVCFAVPINLYVERSSGAILSVANREREISEVTDAPGKMSLSPSYERQAIFGDVAKVLAWYQSACPTPDTSVQLANKSVQIGRPDSWARDSHIVLGKPDPDLPIDTLLSDPNSMAIFLQSLEAYNAPPEPKPHAIRNFFRLVLGLVN